MAESKGFYFDKIRASADMTERLVIQGYSADAFLEDVRPRAAVFVSGKNEYIKILERIINFEVDKNKIS